MAENTLPFDPGARATFERDGVVCLRGILQDAPINALIHAIDEIVSDQGSQTVIWGTPSEEKYDSQLDILRITKPGGRSAETETEVKSQSLVTPAPYPVLGFGAWRDNLIIRAIGLDSTLPELVAQILGGDKVNFCGDQILLQEPRTQGGNAFHRDDVSLPMTGGIGCSISIPLSVIDNESEALTFVRGSHLVEQDDERVRNASHTSGWRRPAEAHDKIDESSLIRYITAPGDVVVHDFRTLYTVGGNSSTERKLAISYRYAEHMVFSRRQGVFVQMSDIDLETGDLLDSLDFPVVWPRPFPDFAIAPLYKNDHNGNGTWGGKT